MIFQSARIKLTLWYLVIIAVISAAFSAFIYQSATYELDRFVSLQQFRIERRLKRDVIIQYPQIIDMELIEDTKKRIMSRLLFVDGIILIFAGGLSYWLAGRTLQPIRSMVDSQKQFISDASHEFKTPLTALKTSIEVHLRDPQLKLSEARKLLEGSLREVNKMHSLTRSLLNLAKYEDIKSQTRSKNSLNDILDTSIKQIRPLAEAKKIKIVKKVDESTVFVNKDEVVELISIFIDNAIKYSESDTTIIAYAKRSGKLLKLKIKDQGIGIKPSERDRIFDRFYRSDLARTKNGGGGYGLGLSIAKQIVSKYHGSIDIDSKVNRGTTFTITLQLG